MTDDKTPLDKKIVYSLLLYEEEIAKSIPVIEVSNLKEAIKRLKEDIVFGKPKNMEMMISTKEVINLLTKHFGEGLTDGN